MIRPETCYSKTGLAYTDISYHIPLVKSGPELRHVFIGPQLPSFLHTHTHAVEACVHPFVSQVERHPVGGVVLTKNTLDTTHGGPKKWQTFFLGKISWRKLLKLLPPKSG